ncbi:MAG: PAS domain-containing protein [bacterium]|nr:PAS domain-containing protein [bacterium]
MNFLEKAQLLDALGEAVIATDPDGRVTYWNQTATDLYGWDETEALGRKFEELIRIILTPERVTPRSSQFRCGRRIRIESYAAGKNGVRFPVVMSEAPIKNCSGETTGYVNVSTEIWVRDPADDALSATEQAKLVELREALVKIKPLGGFIIPICASCKKIRDDKGYWNQLEEYIRDHFEAEFSHSVCPDCARELFPELFPPS